MLNSAALVVGSNAIDSAITHMQLYSGSTDTAGTLNAVGTRVAITAGMGVVGGTGNIVWTGIPMFTGLAANQAIARVGYFNALTGGTFYGSTALTGDATANAAGEYTVTQVAENASAS